MKKYISPDIEIIEVESDNNIMYTSNLGVDHGTPKDDFNAPSRRGSGWDDYEQ